MALKEAKIPIMTRYFKKLITLVSVSRLRTIRSLIKLILYVDMVGSNNFLVKL